MGPTRKSNRALESVRFGVALVALALASQGCAAPEVDDEIGADEGAAKVGGRGTSPLEPGLYDSDYGMLSITNWADRQYVSFTIARAGGALITCWGMTADIKAGQASVDMPECALRLTTNSDRRAISVAGTLNDQQGSTSYSGQYRRRPKDALVGTYAKGNIKLTVEASEDEALTYSIMVGDQTVATHEPASSRAPGGGIVAPNGTESNSFYGKTNGCPIQVSVDRREGVFGISLAKWGEATDLTQCVGYTGSLPKQR